MQRFFTVAAAVLVLAAPAFAFSEVEQRSIAVSYADLNLDRPAGRQALDRRIQRAIKRICYPGTAHGPETLRLIQECRADARASVAPQLAALYGGERRAHAAVTVAGPAAR